MLLRLSPGDLVESRASLKRQRVQTACRQAQGGSFPVQLPQTEAGSVQSSTSQAETGLRPLIPVTQPQFSRTASPQAPLNGSAGVNGTFDSHSATEALTGEQLGYAFMQLWRACSQGLTQSCCRAQQHSAVSAGMASPHARTRARHSHLLPCSAQPACLCHQGGACLPASSCGRCHSSLS